MAVSGHLCAFFFLISGTVAKGLSVKFELTYHNTEASWNTATNVCKSNGGRLVKVDSREKSTALNYFMSNFWKDEWVGYFWMGLFEGDPPNKQYTWPDCTLLLSNFINWDDNFGEPNNLDVTFCVRGTVKNGKWRTTDCSYEYKFICEKMVGECTYSSLEGEITKTTNDAVFLPHVCNTTEDCQAKCEEVYHNGTKCWAVTYGPNGSCILYYADHPFQPLAVNSTSDPMSYSRICYNATTDLPVIEAELMDNSSSPSVSCQEISSAGEILPTSAPDFALTTTQRSKYTDLPTLNLINTSEGPETPNYNIQSVATNLPSTASVDATTGESTIGQTTERFQVNNSTMTWDYSAIKGSHDSSVTPMTSILVRESGQAEPTMHAYSTESSAIPNYTTQQQSAITLMPSTAFVAAASQELSTTTWNNNSVSSLQETPLISMTTTLLPGDDQRERSEQGTPLKYELTFYGERCSWNTANNVCNAKGGNLVQISSSEKSEVIQYFAQNDWKDLQERLYWIGLFDDDIPNMLYTWTDCTLMESKFQKWYSDGISGREPNDVTNQSCVATDRDDGNWWTKPCVFPYQFICEKTIGECTYSSVHGNGFPTTSDSVLLPDTYNTIEDCQAKCSVGDNSDMTCWAVTYGDVQKTCTIHKEPSPFTLTLSDARHMPNHTASIRICYTASVDQSTICSGLVDDSSRPSFSCREDSNPVTTQYTIEPEVQPITLQPEDTCRSSVQPSTVERTTEYSVAEHMLLSSKSPEQLTVRVLPSPSTVDTTMWTLFESCAGSSCTIISQQDGSTVSETDMAGEPQTVLVEHGRCRCPRSTPLSEEESAVVMSHILGDMITVDKRNVSAYKRKHESAPDDRPSAQSIGGVGAIILGVIFGGIMVQDLPRLHHDMRALVLNFREK